MSRYANLSLALIVALGLIAIFASSPASAQKSKPAIIDIKSKLLFDVAVMKNQKKPFVVFYYSSSECIPCKWSLLPMLEKMVRRKGDYVNLAMVDFDKVPELREAHGVSEIPTIMVFFKGEIMDIVEGKNWNPIVAAVNRATKLAFE